MFEFIGILYILQNMENNTQTGVEQKQSSTLAIESTEFNNFGNIEEEDELTETMKSLEECTVSQSYNQEIKVRVLTI